MYVDHVCLLYSILHFITGTGTKTSVSITDIYYNVYMPYHDNSTYTSKLDTHLYCTCGLVAPKFRTVACSLRSYYFMFM